MGIVLNVYKEIMKSTIYLVLCNFAPLFQLVVSFSTQAVGPFRRAKLVKED